MTPEEFGKILAERDIEKMVTHRAQVPDSCWGIVKHYAYCFRLGLTAPRHGVGWDAHTVSA